MVLLKRGATYTNIDIINLNKICKVLSKNIRISDRLNLGRLHLLLLEGKHRFNVLTHKRVQQHVSLLIILVKEHRNPNKEPYGVSLGILPPKDARNTLLV